MTAPAETGVLIEHLFRHQAGRVVARLTRLLGPANVALAEEAVQDAMLKALQTWPYQGAPQNPAGWLFRVAHNAAIDTLRRNALFGDKTEALVLELTRSASQTLAAPYVEDQLRDDELRMIFMCCHPALTRDASVALSLKSIGGFSVAEIARAFLVEESTIAQRLVRAKRQIRDEHLTLDFPPRTELAARLDSVLEVLYFMFNEGYSPRDGERLIRQDLCLEAFRLARLVASAPIAEPRVHALVALMALLAARLAARVDSSGDLILFDDQDRHQWDEQLIALGFHHFDQSMSGGEETEYHVQAAIAATHARAVDPRTVDWRVILALYDRLFALNQSPIVALNRAVALARVHGAAEGLAAIEELEDDPALRRYHLLLAARGQLLIELDRRAEAADAFRAALDCPCSEPERRFLQRRLDACARPH
ncbi:MAG TPA: sigma-70 family RNA polymerase sigma factor [Vicinamibacterales bacterium]